jgi:hypothetical protein
MIGMLLRLLWLPVKLVMLPMKLFQAATTFVTCVVPLIALVGIAAAIVWFLFIN